MRLQVSYFDTRSGLGGGAGLHDFRSLASMLHWLNSSETILIRQIFTDDREILAEIQAIDEATS